MDGRVHAAGELRIMHVLKGVPREAVQGGYCITQMRFWSSGQCVHA